MRYPKATKRVIFLLGLPIIVFLFQVSWAGTGDWTTYTNMNEINKVLLKNEKLFCATTGGIAILDISEGTFTRLTNVNGLGGNNLNCVEVDSAGCLWFGAENGTLTKFSSEEVFWKVYSFFDRDGTRLSIKDVVADGDKLWIGTDLGVSLFLIYKHGGEIKETYRRLGEGLQGGEDVNAIHLVGEDIWVGLMGGVAAANKNDPNLLDFSRWTSFTQKSSPGLENDSVYSIIDVEGEVIIGTQKGIFSFDPSDSTWQSLGLQNRIINDLMYYDEKLYAATNVGIYVYEEEAWSQFPDSGLITKYFNSFTTDGNGNFWVGTLDRGISMLSGSVWINHLIDGPPANVFLDMEIDDMGILWCAHETYGASFFDGMTWTSLDSIPEIPNHQIRAVEKDKDNNIWFSTWGGGVVKFDGDQTWTNYTAGNSPLQSAIAGNPSYVVVNDIVVDEVGNRWFPNWGAVDSTRLVCSPAQQETDWIVFYIKDGIEPRFMDRAFARDGHLYICSRNAGLMDYDYNWTLENKGDDRVTQYTSEDHDLSDNWVRCVNLDKDNTLWVGTGSGLDRYDPDYEEFRSILLTEPLGTQVNDIAVDERNNKWIATSNGLGVMNSQGEFVEVFTTFNSKICDNHVLRLKVDKETGHVWVGTENGLSRYESGFTPAEDLSQVIAYPNPFIIREGTELLTFDRLPYGAKVTILTVAGERVKEIKVEDQWNGRNQRGELVASGIYLFHVQHPSSENIVGKIAVIRE
jgi:ligand-binding sensor domain-containing protein